MHLYVDKRNAHLLYSSRSPSTSVSDAEKRVVNCAVARSVNAVPDSPLIPPMFIRDDTYLQRARWARKEAKIAKIKIAVLEGRFKVTRIHPGSFSAQMANSSNRDPQDVRC